MRELDSTSLPLLGSHLIEASAGTGKTYNIVRIYLRLLLERELGVDQILVMTFTNAATAELRNRLSLFLREALDTWMSSDDEIITSLRQIIDENHAKLLLNKAILQLDEATIFTIHSFCKRALSQQAFFSGMSFNANLDADSALLKLQATEDWYRQINQTDDFINIYDQWNTPEQFISHWSRVIDSSEYFQRPQLTDTRILLQNFITLWPSEQESFHKLNIDNKRASEQTRLTNRADFNILTEIAETSRLEEGDRFDKSILKRCFNTESKKTKLASSFSLTNALLHNVETKKVLLALDGIEYIQKHINQDKNRLDQLDFNDLIIQLKKALHGENATELRAAMLEQFPAALIDEFQDTDPDQYAILNAIYTDQTDAFVCMIGDPKQAIYGFRGGDVFAYLKARELVDNQWTMNTNYRSAPSVIKGYNKAFLQDADDINEKTFGFGISYRKVLASEETIDPIFTDCTSRSSVQWVNFEPEELPSRGLNKTFQQTISDWCVQEIIQLISNVKSEETAIKPGDIALLVRGYSEAELMQQTLIQAGINSVYLSSRANVFHTVEARELYRLLSGIWQFENDRAFISALASHWISLNISQLEELQQNEHKWAYWQAQFEQWRNDWQSRGLMSMLLDILQNHFKSTTDRLDRQLTNMLQLAEVLQKESGQHRQPDSLLHWFERAQEDINSAEENLLRLESDDALIKIITMHGAKGLEYPIVFLPFVSYYGKPVKGSSVYRYHDRDNFDARLSFLPTSVEKTLTEEEEQAELVRLFYVATTRASKRLYCCMAPFSSFKGSPLALSLKQEKYDIIKLSNILNVDGAANVLTVRTQDITNHTWQENLAEIDLSPAQFTGHIERDWWLSSFSSLTRHVGHSVHTTPDRDENEEMEIPPTELPLRFRLTKGAEAGNLLHDALEHTDFKAPDYDALYEKSAERYSNLTKTFTRPELEEWINDILQSPLTLGGTLSELSPDRTLKESEFYFPMAGSHIKQLAALLTQMRGVEYQLPDRNKLKGMMHGFIDLIFERDSKFYVADYKSTHLGETIADYSIENMQLSIHGSSYDVQYAIYSLALHRYLKLRIPNYTPEVHFGGVYYFYLRGMTKGSSTGVFYDPLSPNILGRLDDIFSNTPSEGAV